MLCLSIQIFFITCGGDTNLSGLTSGRISGVFIKSNKWNNLLVQSLVNKGGAKSSF